MQQNYDNLNIQDDLDEDLNINLKSFLLGIKRKRHKMEIIFLVVFVFILLLTWILPKKWVVEADLYINKANNSNLAEFNPYVMEEMSTGMFSALTSPLANELEIIQSPLVIEKVIKENNIRYKKLFEIIPTKKTGEYVSVKNFLKKVSIDNKKGTNIISISFKSKKRELSYNVVNSIINNYIELHKIVHSDKARTDKKIIEDEYNKAKAELDTRVDEYAGLPQNAMSGNGALVAMSAFSESARKAMSNVTGEIVENERSKMAVTEESEKVAGLARRLQWAKLVEEMSGTSNVLVIKNPEIPKDWEQASPKLLTQIIFGIIFGVIAAFIYFIHTEKHDKKLTYSTIGVNIIYNLKEEIQKLKSLIYVNNGKFGKTLLVALSDIAPENLNILQSIKNIRVVKADISDDFINVLNEYQNVILLEKIGETNTEEYKTVKQILEDMKKKILTEVLI